MLRLKSNLSSEDWLQLTSNCSSSKSQEEDAVVASMIQRKHNWLSEQIRHLHIDAQLGSFTTLVTMSEDDFRKREQVRYEFLSILGSGYLNVKATGAGDVITGLGDSESILILCVELQDSRCLMEIIENIYRLLISKNEFCKNVSLVENNTLPYINGIHCATEVKMQICFNNIISVQSARLIQFMISLDTRVLPLMLIIRYWASYNIQPPNFIDNYILELLILVFLNKCKILPNVAFLQWQSKNTAVMPLLNNFWNANFCSDHRSITEILSNSGRAPVEYSEVTGKPTTNSILLLAKDFFQMYADVDFGRIAVCSLLGCFIMKMDLDVDNKNARLPVLLQQYTNWSLLQNKEDRMKIDTAMCVQDPFDLGRNVAENVTESSLLTFQNACRSSVNSLERLALRPGDFGYNYNFLDFITMKEENYVQYTAQVGLKRKRPSSTVVNSESEVLNFTDGQTISCPSVAENNAPRVQSHIPFCKGSKVQIEDSLHDLHISLPFSKSSASYVNSQDSQAGFSGSIMQSSWNYMGTESFDGNTCSNVMGQQMKSGQSAQSSKNTSQKSAATTAAPVYKIMKKPMKSKPKKLSKVQKKEATRLKVLHGKMRRSAPDGKETYELRINQVIKADFSYCFNFFFEHVAPKPEIDQKCTALWLSFFKDFFNDVWSIAYKVSTEPHDPSEILEKLYTDRSNTEFTNSYSKRSIYSLSKRLDRKLGASLVDKLMKECLPDPGNKYDQEYNLNSVMASRCSTQSNPHLNKFQQLTRSEQFCQSLLVHGPLDTLKCHDLRHKIQKQSKFYYLHPLERCGNITEQLLHQAKNIPQVDKKFIATIKWDTTKNPMEILLIFTETVDCQGMADIFINLFNETKEYLAQYQNYRLKNWLKLE